MNFKAITIKPEKKKQQRISSKVRKPEAYL
jgi:hypothetical protein